MFSNVLLHKKTIDIGIWLSYKNTQIVVQLYTLQLKLSQMYHEYSFVVSTIN